MKSRLALALSMVLVAFGCEESEEPAAAPAESPTETPTESTPTPSEAPSGCAFSIQVSGEQTFDDDDVNFRISEAERGDTMWLSMMATEVTNQPPYILTLLIRSAATGTVPLEEPGMNKLTLQMVGGAEYSAHATREAGGDPGSLTITRDREGWFSGEGTALLSNREGGEIRVALNVTSAIPPNECPQN